MSNIRTYRVNHAMQMISIPLHSTTNSYHLGNNDEVVDAKGVVQQVTNYYPFGAPYADATASKGADVQPYKYNGKELDLMHGLNTYDYGARQYNPVTARWDRIDPLSEKYYSISPYAYCANNPVMLVDPDGKDVLFGTSDANQIQMILDWINSLARGTFAYEISDEHRGLYLKELKETDKGSQSYTDALIESINNHEQDIVVKITNRVLFRGKEENVDEVYGGGVTYQDKEQGSHSPIIIYMSGNEHKGLLSEGTFKPLKQTPNFIFAHEFYCHAHKYMYPNKVMGRNATTLENVIRRELQKYDKNILLRAIVDINHKKAYHPAIDGN